MITVCPDCLKLECRCAANAKTRAKMRRRRREFIPEELRAETRECGLCRGAGYRLMRDERFMQQMGACGRCGGTGRVRVADPERKQR